jgi:hypothetical protein
MKKSTGYGWIVASLLADLLVGGCSSTYYRVTDPHSGTAYYTQGFISEKGTIRIVKLKDARTSNTVTLQNPEVNEISEKDYEAGLAAPPVAAAVAPTAASVVPNGTK